MASLETMPAEVHFQIFSYISTATYGSTSLFARMTFGYDHKYEYAAWNEIWKHPLLRLSETSKTLRNAVEAYCEHRLQHLRTVCPPGKGPSTPFSLPLRGCYLGYMAGHCTFCYELAKAHGIVDVTLPACWLCKSKFPQSRMIRWERAEKKYELPLEELKASCAWAPVDDPVFSDDSEYESSDEDFYYRSSRRDREPYQTTYAFDTHDIQRHIERRYGGLDTFFAALEKKHWDKNLELERMAKQRRWASEELERRLTAGETMVERFIAPHKEVEKKRAAEKRKMIKELEARTGKREEVLREWQEEFLSGTARPGGRNNETEDYVRFDVLMNIAIGKLLNWEYTIQHHIDAEEEVAREIMIEQFRQYMKKQATADVLVQYGLDSLVEPAKPKKKRRRQQSFYF